MNNEVPDDSMLAANHGLIVAHHYLHAPWANLNVRDRYADSEFQAMTIMDRDFRSATGAISRAFGKAFHARVGNPIGTFEVKLRD